MAGFHVLWASEFIPAAAEVYRTNFPGTVLDTRDIREVTPREILSAAGLEEGELDLLDGSPPCASFSTSGKREASWGKVKSYSDTKQRVDDLFFEFTRILGGLQPRVFIAENVRGLTIGSAKGYFKQIKASMENCGYKVGAKILDAKWLGVPQMRSRVILFGVRNDLNANPEYPVPLPYYYTVRDALPWIDDDTQNPFPVEKETWITQGTKVYQLWYQLPIGRGGSRETGSYFNLIKIHPDRPSPTVLQSHGANPSVAAGCMHHKYPRKFSIAELKRVSSFPDDFALSGVFKKDWERIGRAVPPLMMRAIAEKAAEVLRKCAG